MPAKDLWIYDYNCSDYQEWKDTSAHLWNVEYGTPYEASEFIEQAYAAGNCFVVLEEADNYLPTKTPAIQRFVNTARNRGIGCWVSAKRPKAVPPLYRTRFDYLCLFRCTLVDDQEYLEDWVGTGKGSLNVLRTLGLGEFILVNTNTGEISQPMKLDAGDGSYKEEDERIPEKRGKGEKSPDTKLYKDIGGIQVMLVSEKQVNDMYPKAHFHLGAHDLDMEEIPDRTAWIADVPEKDKIMSHVLTERRLMAGGMSHKKAHLEANKTFNTDKL